MGTLQGEWNHIQWQLDPYKWYLHSNASYGRYEYNHFKFLPQKYEKRYLLRIMRYLSNEGTLGFLIFLVICFTLYMHIFMLDTTRNFHIPSVAKHDNPQKVNAMLAIVMHSPVKSLKATASSLNASQHKADVFIFRNFVGDDVYDNASRWYPAAKVVSDKGRSRQTGIMRFVMDHFIDSKYDILVYINSYSILCVKWWDNVMIGLAKSNGVFSLYGMERDEQQMENCKDFLCPQSWLGWTGSVWRRNLAERMLSETRNEQGLFRYKMENWCKVKNIPVESMKYTALMVLDNAYMDKRPPTMQWLHPQPSRYTRMDSTNDNKVASVCIAAVLRVRIYREDATKMTAFEIEQWIRYMQFAGVNVVYLYDAYQKDDEKLYSWVKRTFDSTEVVYHDWYFNGTYDMQESIRSAYRHATRKYKYHCEWQIQADINEYPFVANDTGMNFLKRLIAKIRLSSSAVYGISFPIFKFAGNVSTDPLLLWRVQSRYQSRVVGEARPLFVARYVKSTHLFHSKFNKGETIYLDSNIARINRFALNDKDKPATEKVIPDLSMLPIYGYMKQINFVSNKIPLYCTNLFWEFS